MQINYLPLSAATPRIKDADLLLWRGRGLIATAGRGLHYHAATAAWWGDDLMVLDTHWRAGGDIRLLAIDVANYDGLIDWFQVNPDGLPYNRAGVVRYMRRLCGIQYGFTGVVKASRFSLPVIRLFFTPETADDDNATYPPFCSEARSRADRVGGGYDPVVLTSDRVTLPADLARSPFYRYAATLVTDDSPLVEQPSELPALGASVPAIAY